jgi:hypothetical protein
MEYIHGVQGKWQQLKARKHFYMCPLPNMHGQFDNPLTVGLKGRLG